MKSLILALCILGGALAHAEVNPAAMAGTWTLSDRFCTDQNGFTREGHDAYKKNRDRLELVFFDQEGYSYSTIAGESEVVHFSFLGNALITDDTKENIRFRVSDNGQTMTIYSNHFGKGGTCPRGETLQTILRRNK